MRKNGSTATRFDTLASGVRALVRTGRCGRDAVEWSEPFEAGLYLQRNDQGHTVCLALQDHDFAEFDPRHHDEGNGQLMAEDYVLEILKVPA